MRAGEGRDGWPAGNERRIDARNRATCKKNPKPEQCARNASMSRSTTSGGGEFVAGLLEYGL